MTRSITVALLAAVVPLGPLAERQFVEDVREARHHDQEIILRDSRPLAEKRGRTAPAVTVLQTASTISKKSIAQMKEQGVTQPSYPPDGEFSFLVMDGETEIVLIGYIAHGVARRLSEFLAQAPQIRAVGFYSGGGRISEALEIRDLIRSRNIDTYVYQKCLSACTIAFLGGVNRYIDQEGQMGFHGSRTPEGVGFENNPDRDRYLVRDIISFGIDAHFAQRAYMSSNEDMWFPSIAELTRARFVTDAAERRFPTSVLVQHRYTVDSLENAISALERV